MSLDIGIVEPHSDPTVVSPVDPNIAEALEGMGERPHLVDGHLVADIDRGVGVPVFRSVWHLDFLARHHLCRRHGGRGDGARLWLNAGCGLGAGRHN